MLIYVLVLFIVFTFILVPAYLVFSSEIYGDFYFKNIEGRKVLLNSKEKSNVKINYDYVYKNYSNTFRMLKNYFIFLFILFLVILIYNSFSYYEIINFIMENQENIILIFIVLTIGILFFINKIKIAFYFNDTEDNKILYRKILFGNFRKVNGKITYKYFNKKNKVIANIKFRNGSPKSIELKIDKILAIQITIQEITNDNFEANFIMIVDKKFTLMKGNGIFKFPAWLYGNYSDAYSYIKKNFSKISYKLLENTYFFIDIYYNSRPFSDSSSIENCFKDSIINGKLERYYKSGKLYEKFIVANENMYAKYESFYENGNLKFKGNRKIKEFEFHGICEHYYENGKLKERANHNYGYPLGLYESFYENGKLEEKRNLNTDGEGNFENFYENGNLKERGDYRYYKKNGNYEKFYKSGELEERGEYRNGYIKGDFESFYKNGNLKEKGRVNQEYLDKKFEKIGNFECFHENGKLKERGNYKYPSKKDGLFEYYSQNGKLIKKENYKDGELI
ncbi:acetoin ABC transporter permease [Fusobacterium nucleatum]|uniref:toxin-antitoxin system YwqK family antitoxin n=1 Tax=Fusobacterium nucleatum TaxID=851 RepID=UPI0030D33F1C